MTTEDKDQTMKTWQRRADDAKRRHRPSLKNWSKDGFAITRKNDFLALRQLPQNIPPIPRFRCADLSVTDFRQRFESPNLPCILTDLPLQENWSANRNWTLKKLTKDYGNSLFKCGEDDDGYKIKMKLKYFLTYCHQNYDDSPLYIFDSNFYEDTLCKKMMEDFSLPSYFCEDLFSLVGEKKRPPYRWFLIGPERSGTTVHLDPLGTSAWNTSILGRKRWVLFPPHSPKRIVKGLDVIRKGEDDEAINYFVDLLPRIRQQHPELEIIEFIQYPGETVYIPGGWWHGVLNLDATIAITQNFCSSLNFDMCWKEMRSGRKKLAVKWLKILREKHPNLATRADALNAADNFLMYDEKKRLGLINSDKKKKKKRKKEKKEEEKKTVMGKRSSECGTDNEDDDSNDDHNAKKRKLACSS